MGSLWPVVATVTRGVCCLSPGGSPTGPWWEGTLRVPGWLPSRSAERRDAALGGAERSAWHPAWQPVGLPICRPSVVRACAQCTLLGCSLLSCVALPVPLLSRFKVGATPLAGGPPRGELSRAGWRHLAGSGRVRPGIPAVRSARPVPSNEDQGPAQGCVPESSGLLSVCPLPVSHLVGAGFALSDESGSPPRSAPGALGPRQGHFRWRRRREDF